MADHRRGSRRRRPATVSPGGHASVHRAFVAALLVVSILAPAAAAGQSALDRVRRGMALLEDNRVEEAVRELRAAVRQAPENPVARYQLGRALFVDGVAAEALEHLEVARSSAEDAGPVEYLLGQVYLELGRLHEARVALDAARETRPDFPPIRLYLAEICYRAGRLDEARGRLAALAEGYPGWSTPLVRLGSLALDGGEPARAAEHYRASMERETARPAAVWLRIAGALAAAGDSEGALEAYRSAVEADPGFVPARSALARHLHDERQLQAALEAYEAVLQLAPGHGLARLSRAEILALQGREQEALQEVETALLDLRSARRRDPGQGDGTESGPALYRAQELRAELLMKLGRPEAAARQARQVLAADARRLKARFVLGTVLMQAGDPRGRDELRLYKRLNDAAEQRDLADQYRTQAGDPDRARAAYEAVLDADPTDPGALFGIAVLERRAGRPQAAVDALDAARAAGAGGVEWYEERIAALLDLGREEAAREAWTEAHDEGLAPGGEAARRLWADTGVCG